jgi:hypothetical protein
MLRLQYAHSRLTLHKGDEEVGPLACQAVIPSWWPETRGWPEDIGVVRGPAVTEPLDHPPSQQQQ